MKTHQRLDDETLLNTLRKLAATERNVTAELVTCLGEVDRRKLYAERGYSSMFAYCLDALHMAEPSIYVRIHAARCCRRFPEVLQMLRSGQLHLCAIALLSPHLTEKNCDELLAAAKHKSKRQIQEMLRDLAPQPGVKDAVRKLPEAQPPAAARSMTPADSAVQPPATSQAPSALQPATSAGGAKSSPSATDALLTPSPAPAAVPATTAASHPEPLGCGRYKVQCTVGADVRRKIEQAKDLMRKKNPTGDLATLLEAALDQFILAESKRQHGATERPRTSKPSPEGTLPRLPQPESERNNLEKPCRHVPNEVKRHVFARDGGQCTFVSADGRRCGERGRLQYHHEVPFAQGGLSTINNIRLLCECHNALLARKDYGDHVISSRIQQARRGRHQKQGALWSQAAGCGAKTAMTADHCDRSVSPPGMT